MSVYEKGADRREHTELQSTRRISERRDVRGAGRLHLLVFSLARRDSTYSPVRRGGRRDTPVVVPRARLRHANAFAHQQMSGLSLVDYGVERRLNGGRWTFSRDFVPQKGTRRWAGVLQNGNLRQVPTAEDGEAKLRDDLPGRHQLQAAATAAVGTVNVRLYVYSVDPRQGLYHLFVCLFACLFSQSRFSRGR